MWCWRRLLRVPLDCKEIQPVHPKGDQSWMFIGRTDAEAETNPLATWCKELTHWKRPWYWERLKAGEGDDRGWDGWMASPTRWTWVWVNSGSWWWTGRPGMLQSVGSQSQTRLSDWTELNWAECLVPSAGHTGQITCCSRRHLQTSWCLIADGMVLSGLPLDCWAFGREGF